MNGNNNSDFTYRLLVGFGIFALVSSLCLCFVLGIRGHAEGFELATAPADSSQTSEETTSSDSSTPSSDIVIVQNATVDEEFAINNDTQLYAPSAQSATYAPAYDITTGDSYASMLYDVFLNQGNVYDDFIIYRSSDYQYVLIYGSIKDDLSFSGASVVTLNYSNYSQSGKRYNFSYSSDASGSFVPGHYNFVSNIETNNALLFHNYYERRELHACRIALYVLAVLEIFQLFKFFRGGLKSV